MPKRNELYHEAAKRMATSADTCIERIRRSRNTSTFANQSTDPASLAAIAEMDEDWGAAAFAELRSTGFINTDWSRFKWYQPSGKELDDMRICGGSQYSAAIQPLSKRRVKNRSCGLQPFRADGRKAQSGRQLPETNAASWDNSAVPKAP